MKIETSRFGSIEINSADCLFLPDGLIDFPNLKAFFLLDQGKNHPFKWLQSIDSPQTALTIINPLTFIPDYMFEAEVEEVADLKITNPNDVVTSVIITVPKDPKLMSANLRAPLIFNVKNKLGKQIKLNDSKYHDKHIIIEEMERYTQREAKINHRKVNLDFASLAADMMATRGF